ncbi:hypothetical protein EUTSA_v10023150mg [Eutrema salsugineum]|uniref:40S ribosomal protein S25 n=1 Tax=Eutrema salsugineum TaxID=72664 RepID=V4LK23_EUTSA|nr:hypothetical protein EUTSA_v10023150mg [Eutrema salsugineum]
MSAPLASSLYMSFRQSIASKGSNSKGVTKPGNVQESVSMTPLKCLNVCSLSFRFASNEYLPQGNILHTSRSSTILKKKGSTEGAPFSVLALSPNTLAIKHRRRTKFHHHPLNPPNPAVESRRRSKGKQKEKVNNMVLFDQATYDKLMSEAPKFKLITPSILSDRLRINGSLARKAIRDLMAKGTIRMVSTHSSQQIYTRATHN